MSKQMKFGFASMTLAAVLLATLAVLPLRYAAAQNATMSLPGGMMAKDMIKAKRIGIARCINRDNYNFSIR